MITSAFHELGDLTDTDRFASERQITYDENRTGDVNSVDGREACIRLGGCHGPAQEFSAYNSQKSMVIPSCCGSLSQWNIRDKDMASSRLDDASLSESRPNYP